MPAIPREFAPESTLALLRDPYRYISTRCRRHASDVFQARLLLRRTICMQGRDAAELFYDTSRFERHGVTPGAIQKTLFGQGGVQSLDGDEHRQRKRMFVSLLDEAAVGRLAELTAAWWRTYALRWESLGEVLLYPQVQVILCRSVCQWAGVPLEEHEAESRTIDLMRLFNDAGSIGPRHWMSRLARRRANAWIEGIIDQVRSERLRPPAGSAAHVVAWHREPDGKLLSRSVAAVELLNILRPVVAVSVYIVLAAHALHQFPGSRERVSTDPQELPLFVQEIRRYYPFFPFVAARVRHDFQWNGYTFPRGRRVVLDLYGTNHDSRLWPQPEQFRPERFRQWNRDPFNFIPQGGGDVAQHHRCPGDETAVELLAVAVDFLTRGLRYEVPSQDLRVNMRRLPALPRSGFVINQVRLVH